MTTIPDSISATLTAQWTAAGGVLPTIYVTEDHVYSNPPPGGLDYIWIPAKSLLYNPKRMNDKYKNRTYTLELVANSATTADRLKEISDEIERVLDLYPIIGVTLQNITNRQIVTPERMNRPMEQITVTMVSLLTTSTSGYGANTSANYLNSLLMYGSANAAWVPGTWAGTTVAGTVITEGAHYKNADANDALWLFQLSLPLVKGGLKLYTDGFKLIVIDAAAADYVTRIFYQGEHTQATTITYFDTTTTDRTAAGDYTYTIAATDLSSFDYVGVQIQTFVTNVGGLDIGPPLFHVWYA